MSELPAEVWSLVVNYLKPWDALQLRRASRRFNEVVIGCQTYWYRQFTWFLIKQNLRVALWKTACKRTHNPRVRVSLDCFSLSEEEKLADRLGIPVRDLPERVANDPSVCSGHVCSNPQHYIFDVPRSRYHIPIDPSDYHPNQQTYVYRFLIHNYRHRRERCRRFSKQLVNDDLKTSRKRIAALQNEMDKLRRRVTMLEETSLELKMLETNKVFFGCKSRNYPIGPT